MFRRRLADVFIDELNRLYASGSWWMKLADSPTVFLAVRDNSLNAYARGMSVAKVEWDGARVRLKVHEEYLTLASPSASPYVDLVVGDKRFRPVIQTPEDYVARFEAVQQRAGLFSGRERRGANAAARRVRSVIDMEAAFDGGDVEDLNSDREESRSGRLDLVTVTPDARIVAFEGKLFNNHELRSATRPKVCSQLEAYSAWLIAHTTELTDAYRGVLDLHRRLKGRFFAERGAPSASATLVLDPVPRLWIFGHDGYQERRANQIADQVAREIRIQGFTRRHVVVVGETSSLEVSHLV